MQEMRRTREGIGGMNMDKEKKIAEIREWHEGKRDSFPQFTVFEAVGVMLDEIDRIEREYAEERAAHNAHVTELCELEEENRKLRERLKEEIVWQDECLKLEEQLQSAHQEIEQYKQFEQQYNEFIKSWEKYQQDKEKMIEGLHNYMKELDRRGQKAYQNSVIDSDHHQLGMAEAYEVAERQAFTRHPQRDRGDGCMIGTQTLRSVAGHPGASKETLIMFLLRAADEIDRLKRGEWISVKERLPAVGETVLMCYRHHNKYEIVTARFVNGGFIGFWDADVTHWMPLPEPPKEGKNV